MFPVIIIFGKEIGTYAIMASLGAIAAGALMFAISRGKDYRRDQFVHTLLAAAGGAFIGGHLVFGFTQIPLLIRIWPHLSELIHSFGEAWELFTIIFGGMVYYGGFFGGIVGAALYLRHMKMPITPYADLIAPGVPLFHAFGRIGCFLGGCCYGLPWEHGFVFSNAYTQMPGDIPRFPIQLVESFGNLVLCIILVCLFKKGRAKGRLLVVYMVLYAVMRFIIEFFRGDIERGFIGPLSTSQWISLLILASVSVWFMIVSIKKAGAKKAAS